MTPGSTFLLCVAFLVGWWFGDAATKEKQPIVLPMAFVSVALLAAVLACVLMYRGAQ